MRSTSQAPKASPPPPVPPRPSKTVVAEALAKSRRLSPVRALFATQPLRAPSVDAANGRPVVPVRSAPPVPKPSTQLAQPQVVFGAQLRCEEPVGRPVVRPVVFQSAPTKTSRIDVHLTRKPSGLRRVESAKNERNRPVVAERQAFKVSGPVAPVSLPANGLSIDATAPKLADQAPSTTEHNETLVLSAGPGDPGNKPEPPGPEPEKIVQTTDKTMIIVTALADDANNNVCSRDGHSSDSGSAGSTGERASRRVQFDDHVNHETLIAELQSMRAEQDRLLRRQRKPPVDIYDGDSDSDRSRIQQSDWVEVAHDGAEVRLSCCQIYIDTGAASNPCTLASRRGATPSMSALHGLPPLPKSLSGFSLLEAGQPPRAGFRVPASPGPQTPSRAGSSRGATPPTPGSGHVVYPPHPRLNGTTDLPRGRKITTLDTQLAILRREMYGLRQLDLSLLSQLYSLNEAIQDFRQILQEQEDSALSPHSPSPSPSSGDEGDEYYSPTPLRFKPAPPAPPLRRTSNSSSANSSEYGTV